MTDYYCNCCEHFVEEDGAERVLGIAPNIDGLRCPYCYEAELEEIDAADFLEAQC